MMAPRRRRVVDHLRKARRYLLPSLEAFFIEPEPRHAAEHVLVVEVIHDAVTGMVSALWELRKTSQRKRDKNIASSSSGSFVSIVVFGFLVGLTLELPVF